MARLRMERVAQWYGSPWQLYAARGLGTLGPIKIGRSQNPAKRIRAFNTAHRLEIVVQVPEWACSEAEAHARFQHLRLRGEWFEAAPDLLEFLAQLPERTHLHRAHQERALCCVAARGPGYVVRSRLSVLVETEVELARRADAERREAARRARWSQRTGINI